MAVHRAHRADGMATLAPGSLHDGADCSLRRRAGGSVNRAAIGERGFGRRRAKMWPSRMTGPEGWSETLVAELTRSPSLVWRILIAVT